MDRYGRDGERKNKLMRDIIMTETVKPWTPGLPVDNQKYFDRTAEHDGRRWFNRGLTKEKLNSLIQYANSNADKIEDLVEKIVAFKKDINSDDNKENKNDETYDKIILLNNLLNEDYKKSFTIGLEAAERAEYANEIAHKIQK